MAIGNERRTTISSFQGPYRFLSNFWLCSIEFEGEIYPSVEHAYQASKTTSQLERKRIRQAVSSGMAKRIGRHVTIRSNWDDIKLATMYDLVKQKFSADGAGGIYLRYLLLHTGDDHLEEGNTWGDTFWGVCRGQGENHLGIILMSVRSELRAKYGK